jgi:enoyl-CoA hydratase/carnithine racemase
VNAETRANPVEVSLEDVIALAARGELADGHGPLVVISESQHGTLSVLDPKHLGAEPCVVLGSDLCVSSSEELDLVARNVGSATACAVATSVLLRASIAASVASVASVQGAVDARFVLESATYSTLLGGDVFRRWHRDRQSSSMASPSDQGGEDRGASTAVLSERTGKELIITLNRPDRGNAVNRQLRDDLVEVLRLALADESVKGVRLLGNGPSFCTGGDLNEFGTFPDVAEAHQIRLQRSPARLLDLVRRSGRTIVAEMHGNCAGSGVELAAFASTVRAHIDTVFWLPELSLGLVPGAGGTISIVDRIGTQRTAWLLLTGKKITADVAHMWGLIDEITT